MSAYVLSTGDFRPVDQNHEMSSGPYYERVPANLHNLSIFGGENRQCSVESCWAVNLVGQPIYV